MGTAARNMQRTLDTGVTTVRDAGGADLGVATCDRAQAFPTTITGSTRKSDRYSSCRSASCAPIEKTEL
jgi:hypothetical protein